MYGRISIKISAVFDFQMTQSGVLSHSPSWIYLWISDVFQCGVISDSVDFDNGFQLKHHFGDCCDQAWAGRESRNNDWQHCSALVWDRFVIDMDTVFLQFGKQVDYRGWLTYLFARRCNHANCDFGNQDLDKFEVSFQFMLCALWTVTHFRCSRAMSNCEWIRTGAGNGFCSVQRRYTLLHYLEWLSEGHCAGPSVVDSLGIKSLVASAFPVCFW